MSRADKTSVSVGLLALVTFLNIVPQTLVVPTLKALVSDRFGVDDAAAHLFMVLNMAGAVLAAPIAGIVADRIGRRLMPMLVALVLDGLLLFGLTLAGDFQTLLVIRFFEGAANIWALSMVLAMAADEMRRRNRPRMMGLIGASLTFGVAIGVPIGGLLGEISPLTPLHVGAGLALLTAVLAWIALPELPPLERARARFRDVLGRAPRLGVPLAFALVDRFTVGFFVSSLPLHLSSELGLGSREVGMQLALFLLPFSLCSWPMGRLAEKAPPTRLIAIGSLVYGGLVCLVGHLVPPGLSILMLALGVTSSVMFVPTLILTARLAPPGGRDAAMGAFNAAGSLGFLLGPLVARHAYEAGGAVLAFTIAGIAEIVCVVALLPALRAIARDGGAGREAARTT